MKTLDGLAAAAGRVTSVQVRGRADVPITGLAADSRAVRPGFLFAALSGTHTDGHRFLSAAASAGAAAFLVEAGRGGESPPGPTAVEAADLRAALGAMADAFHDHPSGALELVGVTGTNGKTTVTWLLEAICAAAGRAAGVIGTISCRYGGRERPAPNTTPEAPDLQRLLREMADAGAQVVALEASSHALELRRLVGCRFAAAAFTNLGRDHLDFHPDLERYFAAKARLFTEFAPGVSVVNLDDPRGVQLAALARGRVLTYGTAGTADFRALGVEADADGLCFRVAAEGREIALRSRLLGRHNVWNILAAAAVARSLGVPWDAVRSGVAALALVPGRFERVARDGGPVVLVDYAHTPEALENGLRVARELARGRLIAVFGCGGDRDRGKRPLMGAAAARLADVAWITSDNPRSEPPEAIIGEILEGARGAGGAAEIRVEQDRRAAIRGAVGGAAEGDVVLIAGKGHEDYQIAGGRTAHFSDREEAARALEEARCRAS